MATTDWEAIESAYRAGSLSIRAIAERHGVSHTAINNRAAKEGWQRDLTQKVRAATQAKVSSKVSRDGFQSDAETEAQIVDQASDEAASVVLAHREGLAAWRGITNKLRDFLNDAEITEENHASMARSITAGVDAQIKVIKAEREAYNIDSGDRNTVTDTLSDLMDDLSKG
ncbi:hypothetical protein [Citrobacter braakii]|uniref:hypothetical protein n=1 Tax=Citrobacter braakii TaxID=57706 RepID=UPI000CEF3B18|nr:hypothetical protein [Citrobacter braakii]PPS50639.1 hypothetical protein BWR12_13065 [Citrobacter braakii]